VVGDEVGAFVVAGGSVGDDVVVEVLAVVVGASVVVGALVDETVGTIVVVGASVGATVVVVATGVGVGVIVLLSYNTNPVSYPH
jgi:hypothetical protein